MSMFSDIRRIVRSDESHPVYDREMSGWAYFGLWRSLRKGCLPLIAVTFIVFASCCGLFMFLIESSLASENLLLMAFAALIGINIAGETIRAGAGLLATALTATTISAEVESNRLELLRITLIPEREIILAKFAAVFRQLRLPLRAVVFARVVILLGLLLLGLALLVVASESNPPLSPAQVPEIARQVEPLIFLPSVLVLIVVIIIELIFALLIILLSIAYMLVEPFITAALFAALGLFASTLSRSRSGGLATAAGLRIAYGVVNYIVSQFFSYGITLAFVPVSIGLSAGNLPPELITFFTNPITVAAGVIAGMWLFLALLVAWQLGLTWFFLTVAVRRLQRLPHG